MSLGNHEFNRNITFTKEWQQKGDPSLSLGIPNLSADRQRSEKSPVKRKGDFND
ncbi:MAG: hypothetical protein ABR927_02345 [Bacteroidales bacterium]